MDIIKYEALTKAIETGSISAAAEYFGYTPSGINRMINSIENELGFTLLERNNKGVKLTKEGKIPLPHFYNSIKCNEEIKQICSEIKGEEYGQISIGTIYSIASEWLPEIIGKFKTEHPNIKINIIENSRKKLIQALQDREIDICFISNGQECEQWLPLFEDYLVAWLPEKYCEKEKAKNTFSIHEFEKYPFIYTLHDKNTDTGNMLNEYSIKPNIQYYTDDNYTSYKMVEAGLGISVNNSLMAKNWKGKVKILPIEPEYKITLGIAFNKKNSKMPAVKKFIEYSKKFIEKDNKT